MLAWLQLVLQKKNASKKARQILEIFSDGQVHTLKSVADAINGRPNHNATSGFSYLASGIGSLGCLTRVTKGSSGTVMLNDVAFLFHCHHQQSLCDCTASQGYSHQHQKDDGGGAKKSKATVKDAPAKKKTQVKVKVGAGSKPKKGGGALVHLLF